MSLAVSFHVGYAKAGAKCHAAGPCKGTPMPLGTLRMGKAVRDEYSETVEWRHWGCITIDWIRSIRADQIVGLSSLSSSDQSKIRMAINLQRIDPADVPPSAKSVITSASFPSVAPGPSQKKRKAGPEATSGPPAAPTSATITPDARLQAEIARMKRNQDYVLERSRLRRALEASDSSTAPTASQQVRQHAAIMGAEEPDEDLAATQDEPQDELLAKFSYKVVGIQYYNGLVGDGELVNLRREPTNPYDRNAIQVVNFRNVQVGHLKKQVAAVMSPLLDRRVVTVEGIVDDGNVGNRSQYELPITLKVYGPSDKRAEVERAFKTWYKPSKAISAGSSASASTSRAGASHAGPSAGGYGRGGASAASYGGGYGGGVSASQASRVPKTTPAQLAAQKKQQEALAKAHELKSIVSGLERVDNEERRSSLLDKLCEVEDILSLPVHPSPPGIANGNLTVDLLKHQSQALAWALEREYPKLPTLDSEKPVQFWLLKKNAKQTYYYNVATKTPQTAAPQLGRGALNADAMGLGKTLTMLSLILATIADKPAGFNNTTLIVCPLSIISNWEKQIKDHVVPGRLKSVVYHGSTVKNLTAKTLSAMDVVITTYQTVAGEFNDAANTTGAPSAKKRKTDRALFDTKWKRIILDEGHTIRNPKTKMAKACCGLNGERRWILTGTPIINSPRDLGSILTFLQICAPLDNEDFFKRLVLRPLKDGAPEGAQLLSGIMSSICIRRTKEVQMQDKDGNPLVPLPPVEQIVIPVTLGAEARALYDQVEEISKERVEMFLNRPSSIQSNVLSMLTRLRQIALHPALVPASYLEDLRAQENEDDNHGGVIRTTPLTPEEKGKLQSKLAQVMEDLEECPICFGQLSDPRITVCAHAFCLPCITEVITNREPKCPMDRRPLTMGDLIGPLPPSEMMLTQPVYRDVSEEPNALAETSSAKIDQLIHLLRLTPATEKSLVFSQFTTFLDKIEDELRKQGIPFARFDGKMSAKRRQETLERFSVPLSENEAPLPQSRSPSPVSQVPARAADSESPEPTTTTRRGRKTRRAIVLDSDDFVDPQDADGDFIMNGGDESDDDFVVQDDTPKKNEGKSKNSKGKQKARVPDPFDEDDDDILPALPPVDPSGNPRVMLISLKAGALGLNLTVANNVYLMDPWWQEGIESQAIDRVNRIGQKKNVHVYQLIAEDTVESKVVEIQERKKKLISEAFSGIKRTETKRNQREARLQDLVELFGLRQQAATQQF